MLRWLVVLLFACASAAAAPPLTTIQDTLYKADGTRFNGSAVIEWKSFQASEGSNIAPNSITVKLVNGVLRVQLVPTTNASAGAYYVVTYNSNGRIQFTERWAVPPSTIAVRLRDVRVSSVPTQASSGTQVQISDVVGLSEELAIRAVKGAAFVPGRVAVVNANGELEAAMGNAEDCVRVDGSSGACGLGGDNPGFVDLETPAGIVDGANTIFQLTRPPSPPASLAFYRNGVLQKPGFDYTLSGAAVTFAGGAAPQPGDVLLASYRLVDLGSAAMFPQVLCSFAGSATSATSLTRLGRCTLPAGLLQTGDRIEIRFDCSHEGAGTAFSFELRWENTSLGVRSAAAGEAFVTGRAAAGIHTSGAQWSVESWGSVTPSFSSAGVATDSVAAPISIAVFGQMAAAGSETVTLRNLTVIRYPQQPGS